MNTEKDIDQEEDIIILDSEDHCITNGVSEKVVETITPKKGTPNSASKRIKLSAAKLKEREEKLKTKELERILKEKKKEEERLIKEQERMRKEKLIKEKEKEKLKREKFMKEKEEEKLKREKEREEKRIEKEKLAQQMIETANKKLEKQKSILKNFFIPLKDISFHSSSPSNKQKPSSISSTPTNNNLFSFKPFVLKKDTRMAPLKRRQFLQYPTSDLVGEDYLKHIKNPFNVSRCLRTFVIPKSNIDRLYTGYYFFPGMGKLPNKCYMLEFSDHNLQKMQSSAAMDEIVCLSSLPSANINVHKHNTLKKLCTKKIKYLHFHENSRPPYYGTWRARSFFTHKLKLARTVERLKADDGIFPEADVFGDHVGLNESKKSANTSITIAPIAESEPHFFKATENVHNDNTRASAQYSSKPKFEINKETKDTTYFYDEIKIKEYSSKIKRLAKVPFSKFYEDIVDYNNDSDEDWEEGDDVGGESLHSNDDEGEDKMDEGIFDTEKDLDDYSSDEGFIVEHGYLSQEEYKSNAEDDFTLLPPVLSSTTTTTTACTQNDPNIIVAATDTDTSEKGKEFKMNDAIEQTVANTSKTITNIITSTNINDGDDKNNPIKIDEHFKSQQKIKLNMWKENVSRKSMAVTSDEKLIPTIKGPIWSNKDVFELKRDLEARKIYDFQDRFKRLMIMPLVSSLPINVTEKLKAKKSSTASTHLNYNLLTNGVNGRENHDETVDYDENTIPSDSHFLQNGISTLLSTKSPNNYKKLIPELLIPHLAKICQGNPQRNTLIADEFRAFIMTNKLAIETGRTPNICKTNFDVSPYNYLIIYKDDPDSDIPCGFKVLTVLANDFPKQHIINTIKNIAKYEHKNKYYKKPCWVLRSQTISKYFPNLIKHFDYSTENKTETYVVDSDKDIVQN